MNRLQKKCLIATAGMHLLLIVILIVGPGFFSSKPKLDDTPILTLIPNVTTDKPFTSGQPTPQTPPPTPPTPTPPTPQPVVTPPPPPPPPEPKPEPQPDVKPQPEPDKPDEPVTPDAVIPAKHKPLPKHPEIKIDLDHLKVVRRHMPTTSDSTAEDEAEQKREARRARRIAEAARNIESRTSTATEVSMPSSTHSSVSFAPYAQVVRAIYERAWVLPDTTASDDAEAEVTVTIASDGTVISASIINPSGDSSVDASVQRALDHVTFVAAFPDGATETKRTFTIKFNLKAKRQLG